MPIHDVSEAHVRRYMFKLLWQPPGRRKLKWSCELDRRVSVERLGRGRTRLGALRFCGGCVGVRLYAPTAKEEYHRHAGHSQWATTQHLHKCLLNALVFRSPQYHLLLPYCSNRAPTTSLAERPCA